MPPKGPVPIFAGERRPFPAKRHAALALRIVSGIGQVVSHLLHIVPAGRIAAGDARGQFLLRRMVQAAEKAVGRAAQKVGVSLGETSNTITLGWLRSRRIISRIFAGAVCGKRRPCRTASLAPAQSGSALPVALVEERGGLRVVREPHRIDPHAFEQACLPALRLIGGGQPDIWILLVAVDAPELERLSVERKSLLRDLGETDARRSS